MYSLIKHNSVSLLWDGFTFWWDLWTVQKSLKSVKTLGKSLTNHLLHFSFDLQMNQIKKNLNLWTPTVWAPIRTSYELNSGRRHTRYCVQWQCKGVIKKSDRDGLDVENLIKRNRWKRTNKVEGLKKRKRNRWKWMDEEERMKKNAWKEVVEEEWKNQEQELMKRKG